MRTRDCKLDDNYVSHLESALKSSEEALQENKHEKQILEVNLKRKDEIITELRNNMMNTTDQMKIEIENRFSNEKEMKLKILDEDEHNKKVEKDRRIRELESALRETIKLSTEREMVLIQEEKKRHQIMQKVSKTTLN